MPNLISSEIRQKLDEVDDWPRLLKRMTAYAVSLAMREYQWQPGTVLPKGSEIQDLVFTVVKKLYTGERTWDPDKVSLGFWLQGNIRSEMNNLFRSAYTSSSKLREVTLTDTDGNVIQGSIEPRSETTETLEDDLNDPESIILEKEMSERRRTVCNALYKALEGDKLLEEIYFQLLDGCERKPRVLAEKLGKSTTEINNALRRLDRHIKKILDEQGGDNE